MVTSHATTAPTAVMPGTRAGSVPCSPTSRYAMPAVSTRKYDPGGPTRNARHSPAVTVASSTAVTAKARWEPAVNTPREVAMTRPRPMPATVAARRRSGAAGA